LRLSGIDTPRVHDVSDALLENRGALPRRIRPHADKLARYSRTLRRDRELAFYGSEDLTPTDFYREKDAREARAMARAAVACIKPAFAPPDK
jgi:HEPN domain-containing protein